MRRPLRLLALSLILALPWSAQAADGPAALASQAIDGTVSRLDGHFLRLQPAGQPEFALRLTDGMRVVRYMPVERSAVTPGAALRILCQRRADGVLTALEIRLGAPYPPGRADATLPNGMPVTQISGFAGRIDSGSLEIRRPTQPGGRPQLESVILPDSVKVYQAAPADIAEVKPGRHITVDIVGPPQRRMARMIELGDETR